MKTSEYCSGDKNKIFQTKPPFRKPSQFKAKGWTETEEGYINEAKKLTMCLLRNRRYMDESYTWAVHINFNEVLSPAKISTTWSAFCHNFRRRGVVCLWVREPNGLNKVHYHLVIKGQITRQVLAAAIESSMPPRSEVKWRKKIETIENEWRYFHYITKAKIAGRVKGKLLADMHQRKRRLFKPKLGIDKYGKVGEFWANGKSKKILWEEIRAVEERIADGLEDSNVQRLVDHVADMVGESVPRSRIERSFGYWSESPSVQDWINRLVVVEWCDDPWLITPEVSA